MPRVVRKPVVRRARSGQRNRVRWVIPFAAGGAGCDRVLGLIQPNGSSCRHGAVPVWYEHASGNPSDGDQSAEHAVAADRFAREIGPFLTAFPGRSRQLNGNPLGYSYPAFSTRGSYQIQACRSGPKLIIISLPMRI